MVPMECKGHAPRINFHQTVLFRAADQGSAGAGGLFIAQTRRAAGIEPWLACFIRRTGAATWLVGALIVETF